jgi:prefoldin subunit 5
MSDLVPSDLVPSDFVPSDLVPNFSAFMRTIDSKFTGTPFEFKGKKYNVSRHNDELWSKISEAYKYARMNDPTIVFGIPFCIGYQNAMHTPDSQKIFGRCIGEEFPVPKNVQEYFKFCTVLQLDKKAESLASTLNSVNSAIFESNVCLGSSNSYLQELLADVEQLQRDFAEIQSKFDEADQRAKALTNLEEASRKVSSLFGSVLAVLQPEFFSVKQDCENSIKIFSDQICALKALISDKDKMVFDQRHGIAQIEGNLRAQVQKKKETESALHGTKQQIFCELSKLESCSLPPTISKYVEESRLHTNMQQAALVLEKHLGEISMGNFESSRNRSEPTECSLCVTSKENYFVLNCGHGAFCSDCISKFNKCPNCRTPFKFPLKPLNIFDKKHFF